MTSTLGESLSKSQLALAWLRERILQHEFAPGYRLVLGSIADELDMSVVPVREAVRQLEAEGLVTYERNVGARVAMMEPSEYAQTMQCLGLLEAAATALSARHATPEDLREARELNGQMTEELAVDDPHQFTAMNRELHAVLIRRCPNARLLELVEGEWAKLRYLRDSTFSFVPHRAVDSIREHEAIITLIEKASPAAEVEDAARHHRLATLRAYLSHEHPHLNPEVFDDLTPPGGSR